MPTLTETRSEKPNTLTGQSRGGLVNNYKIIVDGPGSSGEVTMALKLDQARAMYAFADAFNGHPDNQYHASPTITVVRLKGSKK